MMFPQPMKVLIVDDHPLFSDGLRLLLKTLGIAKDAQTCANSDQALALLPQMQCELILMDWNLGRDSLSGVALISQLKESAPAARLVVVSGEANATSVRAAIDAGAVGFVPKETGSALLVDAIRVTSHGGIYLPAAAFADAPPSGLPPAPIAPSLLLSEAYPTLTPRQLDVLVCALRGEPNKVIARQLDITEGTVKQHLKGVYQTLGVHNRAEAIYLLSRQGVRVF